MEYFSLLETAEKLGVSTDTIRRWDKKGLIKSYRNDLNHRIFKYEEVKRLHNKLTSEDTNKGFKVLKTSKKSGYTCIELFAGAGGTALGMENAGIEHLMLNEYDRDCVNTLKNNQPKWNVIHKDVRELSFDGMVSDIVQGGFPCQAFSYAGKRQGFGDTRGTLFYEFLRAVKTIKPKIAVGENVRGLESHDEGNTLKTMIHELENLGYKVAYKILKAQYLDVPQKRERMMLIGIRKDLDLPILFPKERDYTISLREALQDVPKSLGQVYSANKKKVMDLIPQGGYWRDLPDKLQQEYMGASYFHTGGRTGMARRMSWNEPCLTLTTSPSQKQTERCHPDETRPFTVREYARIQTFPDEWNFSGGLTSQYKQIGNAVPVNLGYHMGKAIIAMLNNGRNNQEFELAS